MLQTLVLRLANGHGYMPSKHACLHLLYKQPNKSSLWALHKSKFH